MNSSSSAPPSPSPPAPFPIDALGDGGSWKLGRANKLMIASASGSLRTLEKLIRQGARVNVANEFGFTAMHFAAKAKSDNKDVIQELQKQGLSVSIFANNRKVNSGLKEYNGFTPLHLVENAGSATAFIELGADPNAEGVSPSGFPVSKVDGGVGTCLSFAGDKGNAPVLRALIEGGAFFSEIDCWFAAKLGRASTMKVFLENGFDLSYV